MGFYDLTKEERTALVAEIQFQLQEAIKKQDDSVFIKYGTDEDTYIRKSVYLGIGKIYNSNVSERPLIINQLERLQSHESEFVRQTVVNAAGEIGMFQFKIVQSFFDTSLFDEHHRVRNAVIGSIKKMSEKNPKPVLHWAKQYLEHPDKEIRREICHGIELRGRTHPQDILPMLKSLQFDQTHRVRDTLVHVIGQISYKKGCLPIVIKELNSWQNKHLVKDAVDEIVDVHSAKRYEKFSYLKQTQVVEYISKNLNELPK